MSMTSQHDAPIYGVATAPLWSDLMQAAPSSYPHPFYFILDDMVPHGPMVWEPRVHCIRDALEAGMDLKGLCSDQSGLETVHPNEGSVLDVMVLNANVYFETHPSSHWPEYLGVLEQVALQGVAMKHTLTMNKLALHRGAKVLHAAIVVGRQVLESIRALGDVDLDFTVFDSLIVSFGRYASGSIGDPVLVDPSLLTFDQEHYIHVARSLQEHSIHANMNEYTIMFYEERGNYTFLHLSHKSEEDMMMMWSRLIMVLHCGLAPQLLQARTAEGRHLIQDVMKAVIVHGFFLSPSNLAFLPKHGLNFGPSMPAAIAHLHQEKTDLQNTVFTEDPNHKVFIELWNSRIDKIDLILQWLYKWLVGMIETQDHYLIERTIYGALPLWGAACSISSFLVGSVGTPNIKFSFEAAKLPITNVPSSKLPASSEKDYSEVVQPIVHTEAAAIRDPLLLNAQMDEEWASLVEMRLHACRQQPDPLEDDKPEDVFLLQYKSHTREFTAALLDGIPLRACRDALTAAHRPFILPDSEAKIFVKPEQWDDVMSRLEGAELRPYHVIVTSSFEYLVDECLMQIPYRRRPRVKQPDSVGRKLLPRVADAHGGSVFDDLDARICSLVPKRTFLCCAPLLRNPQSICQSTADHYAATRNPRRYKI